jgi:hypothetical protein
VKERRTWTKDEIREVIWCYMLLQTTFYRQLQESALNIETTQPRMQKVHGCQETTEPEKLYYETQKDNGDRTQANKEGTAKKSAKSPRGKRRRKARTVGYHKGR